TIYLRGYMRSHGRINRLTLSRDQGKLVLSSRQVLFDFCAEDSVPSEGSIVITGARSSTPSIE
ncbi:unnamed protein product, partial [Rotaria socialis]